MSIDKSWMDISNRCSPEYQKGVCEFLKFAFSRLDEGVEVRCPCKQCNNTIFSTQNTISEHLIVNGINKDYKRWFHHGEKMYEFDEESGDEIIEEDRHVGMRDMLNDFGHAKFNNFQTLDAQMGGEEFVRVSPSRPNEEAEKFYRLLKEVQQALYPGCESFSKLSFIVELMNIKCLYGLSGKSVDALLALFSKAFPSGNKVPTSFSAARKVVQDLGLDYVKIDSCVNDCILYRKKYAEAQQCPVCGVCRWKNNGGVRNLAPKRAKGKNIPQKILRYFPLTPRLKMLYMSSNVASEMRWHKDKLHNDGYMRHPADSIAWKSFDSRYPSFAADSRNVRLGLASDGFNPFGNMSTSYSVWPVVLVPYNLPPWMCMKDPYFMMSLLIPGPKAPGNDIDVYLQPLIDELKELWENGVETYDASSECNFQLRAAVLWTINDFPAYANLSGWSTKGKLACPCCNMDTWSYRLRNGHKTCYMGHRRFLPLNHAWRNNAKSFDGTKEKRPAPKQLSGDDVVEQFSHFEQVIFGKTMKKRKRGEITLPGNWKKKSIFFELPYWRTLKLRHNLDLMHIEKNVCDNVLGTLLNLEGKSKDNINARFDLEYMGIRPELHATPMDNGKYLFHPACYTMSKDEKRAFCEFLNDLKVPDGYASNISRCVNSTECKISGMKCHDCHVFLHRYLPLTIRGMLHKDVCEALIELSAFFRELCSKTLSLDELERLEKSIVVTLCKLEKIFPPSFFDIMVHLPVHLVGEAKVAGPVQFRWMYSIERFLRGLKSYVRNKARPEGSIAEGYLLQECVTFCSRYLHGVETRLNRVGRNYEGGRDLSYSGLHIFAKIGKPLHGNKYEELGLTEWAQARMYVLKNCEEVSGFINMHKEEIKRDNPNNVETMHEKQFYQWFKRHVNQLHSIGNASVSDQLLHLACGPDRRIFRYTSYLVNGWRFNTKERDMHLKSQNSGVLVKGDNNTGYIDYYGVLTDIIELNYQGGNNVVLFKCDWWDVYHKGKGFKEDKYGFIMVNVKRKLDTDEPYVLATQAEQIYYVKDTKDPNWQVVVKTKPRDLYDFPLEEIGDEPCQENEDIRFINPQSGVEDDDNMPYLNRPELASTGFEGSPIKRNPLAAEEEEESEEETDDEEIALTDDEEIDPIDEESSDDD